MTRQELADAVNVQVYRSTGEIAEVDANQIGKWERGDIQWPAERYRRAFRVVLGAVTDIELGFSRRGDGCSTSDVDRKTFLRTTVGLGAGVVLASRTDAVGAPAEDGLAETIIAPTEHYRRMEAKVSSRYLAPAAEGHLRLARQVLRDRPRNAHCAAVLSETAGLTAWLAVDRADVATARDRYLESIRHAESSGNPLLISYMLGSLGQYAVEIGDPRQGSRLLIKAARYHDGNTPAAARAWLASIRAVAHGASEDRSEMIAALNSAERDTNRGQGDACWPWMFAFTSAKLMRYQSSALAKFGDLSGARGAYASAIPTITAPKPRALAKVEYANLLANLRQEDEAVRLGLEAFRAGRQYGSERVISGVRVVRSKLTTRNQDVCQLDREIAELYDEEH